MTTLRALLVAAAVLLLPGTATAATSASPQPARVVVPKTPLRPSTGHTGTATAVVDNNTPKTDTTGTVLDAHEGTIVYDAGQYWMVGNTYSCDGGYEWIHRASAWCGFRTYSSPDLVHWTNRGATFNPDDPYFQQLCAGMGCFDARLIRDDTATPPQWRLWFNAYNSRSGYAVLSSSSITGSWRLMPTPNLALNNNHPGRGNGAGGLYTASDGTGYLVYTDWPDGGLDIIERLDPHMITGTGVHVHIPNASAEAPSLFNGPNGETVVTYDDPGCAWCGGVPTSYAVTTGGPLGLWHVAGQLSALSCDGQAASQVATLHSGQLLWITDQWSNVAPGPRGPGVAGWTGMTDINTVGNWNQTLAPQLWEPLTFTAGGGLAPATCSGTASVAP